jgi:O-antigen/teichoic acid export membrane protein
MQIPLIDFIATPMADVMMVKMTEARRDGAFARARALWHQAAIDLALLFVPLVGFLLVVADELVMLLFTESYVASVPIFRISVLTILFTPLLIDSVLRVHADTRFILLLNGLQLAIIASSIGPLLGRYGLAGGVLVIVIAMAVVRGAGLARLKHSMDLPFVDLLPWTRFGKVLAVSAGASLLSGGVKLALAGPPLVTVLAAGSAHVLVWAVLGWRLGLLPLPSPRALGSRLRRLRVPVLGSQRAD